MDVCDLPHTTVRFQVAKLPGAELLWQNCTHSSRVNSTHMVSVPLTGTASTDLVAFAERYGGSGLGGNGGGSRSGNIGNLQVKGIGLNRLRNPASVHLDGKLSLYSALAEVIYSTLLHRFLPMGVVQTLGLAGQNKQDSPLSEKPVLLFREKCLRPAHFLQNQRFHAPLDLVSECARLRAIHRDKSIQKFLLSKLCVLPAQWGMQFGFAQASGVQHGSLTPSNLCLEGRWLDVVHANFLSIGERGNRDSLAPPFWYEPQRSFEIIAELAYAMKKFGRVYEASASLKEFEVNFRRFFRIAMLRRFGISRAVAQQIEGIPETIRFENWFAEALNVKPSTSAVPDDLTNLIQRKPPSNDVSRLLATIQNIAKVDKTVVRLRACRNLILQGVFHQSSVDRRIQHALSQDHLPDAVSQCIEDFRMAGRLLTEDTDHQVTVFDTPNLTIRYLPRYELFVMNDQRPTLTSTEVSQHLMRRPANEIAICGSILKEPLIAMMLEMD
jgi:hypothetical protein